MHVIQFLFAVFNCFEGYPLRFEECAAMQLLIKELLRPQTEATGQKQALFKLPSSAARGLPAEITSGTAVTPFWTRFSLPVCCAPSSGPRPKRAVHGVARSAQHGAEASTKFAGGEPGVTLPGTAQGPAGHAAGARAGDPRNLAERLPTPSEIQGSGVLRGSEVAIAETLLKVALEVPQLLPDKFRLVQLQQATVGHHSPPGPSSPGDSRSSEL